MLTATQAKNIAGTSRYFDSTLSQGDYYTGQEINGAWHGKTATMIGIAAGTAVTPEQFKNLLAGKHPMTGKQFAQRARKDRRPGFDLTFSCPKSVSTVWAITKDETILTALQEAVHETMEKDVEPLMCRRYRSGSEAFSRLRKKTGNLIYADFLHKTSRPVDGVPDPHLHVHAFVMNTTLEDGKHYAAEPEEIFRSRPHLQAAFEARLARKLEKNCGYAVTRTAFTQSGRLKKGWEIDGIARSTIEKFARRTAQVETEAEARGITDADAKSKLGASTREKKDHGTKLRDLREKWTSRLSSEEHASIESLRSSERGNRNEIEATISAVRYAVDHHLFRQSTAEKSVIMATALEHGVTLEPEAVETALTQDGILQKNDAVRGVDRQFITTRDVLEAEQAMIDFARDRRGTRMQIARSSHVFEKDWLDKEQKAAVLHVLSSTDQITAITGGAGTGKSSLMEEAAAGIKANDRELFVFAPSTGAREVLEEKGFANAQTVEHLLRNEKLHPKLKDQVIWIDEAGLLDVRSMNGIFAIADAQNCRVVLSGDTKQHSSPRRGEAMRLLETEAGLNIARVHEIQRQKGLYKKAIELVSLGDARLSANSDQTGLLAGFDLLDRLGKIKEIKSEERHGLLAKRYLAARRRKRSTLIVAPTHAEGKAVTAEIRDRLRRAGAIGGEEFEFTRLQALNLSEAEKGNSLSYRQDNLIIQFHQNVAGGFKRGERYRVLHGSDGEITLCSLENGASKAVPLDKPDRFEVYREETAVFSVGDKVRFSLGGTGIDGKRRISNGRIDQIKGLDDQGNLRLESGLIVSKDYGHFDHGYCVTSHGSQGKDCDLAIAAMGSHSLPAMNAKQFYVTVSRGKRNVAIYVDDKEAVRRAIQNAGEQRSATELMKPNEMRQQHELQAKKQLQDRAFLVRVREWWNRYVSSPEVSLARPHTPTHVAPSIVPTPPTLERS